MRFLVTGGAGFIGSAYVRNLLQGNLHSLPTKVTVLDKLTYAGSTRNLLDVINDGRLTFIHGDICDQLLVDSLTQDVDVIVNFAAESHVDRSIKDAKDFLYSNTLGAGILAQSAVNNGVKTFIQISTDEVYGSIDSGSWDETFPLEPNSPYAASKASAEIVIRGIGKTHELDYRITRCANNYGTHQFPEKLIPGSIVKLLKGDNISIYGNGQNVREWIHVDDHCRAIDLVLHKGGFQETYNIGGNESFSNLEVARLIVDIMNLDESRIKFVEDRKQHDFRYSVDDTKIKSKLGFSQTHTLVGNLPSLVGWYRENLTHGDVESKGIF